MELSELCLIRIEILYEDYLNKIQSIKSCGRYEKKQQYVHLFSREFYDIVFLHQKQVQFRLPFYSESAYKTLEEKGLLKINSLQNKYLKKYSLTYDHIHKPQLAMKKELEKFFLRRKPRPLSKKKFRLFFEKMAQTICVTKEENNQLSNENLVYDDNLFVVDKQGKEVDMSDLIIEKPITLFSLVL